jgi:AI-2 transport protein TqsA
VVHAIVGNVVEPKVFGDSLELHPIVVDAIHSLRSTSDPQVLLSLAFWFALWGTPGAILSVPITAVCRIIITHIRHPYASGLALFTRCPLLQCELTRCPLLQCV